MGKSKKITLHPVLSDGSVDTSVNLYPKTNNIVDEEGNEVTVQKKLTAGENISIENNTISAIVDIDAYNKEESDNKFATKEELATKANDDEVVKLTATAADAGKILAVDDNGNIKLKNLSSGTKWYRYDIVAKGKNIVYFSTYNVNWDPYGDSYDASPLYDIDANGFGYVEVSNQFGTYKAKIISAGYHLYEGMMTIGIQYANNNLDSNFTTGFLEIYRSHGDVTSVVKTEL